MKKSDLAVFAILLVSFLALICQIIISATPNIEVEVAKIEGASVSQSSNAETSSVSATSSEVVSSNIQSGLININTADLQTLIKLDKIGEARANAIINYRNENGPFKKIEDIMDVSGIGEGIFNAIKNDIEV